LSPSDDRLVDHAVSGDGAAFEGIYERYHQPIYRYALSILRDPQDAQDTMQSTMERALRSIGSQRVGGGLKAWLFGIAHNEAMDTLGRRRGAPSEDAPLLAADAASDAGKRESMRQLMADLGTLPERQRSALVLRELSGLNSEEIGTALSISPSSAKQSVYEARVALNALAEGRDMSCDRVQQKISAGDGRRLRGRRLRAHVRDCTICQAFTAGIGTRTAELPCLFPPLAAVAAAKTFAAVTGGAGIVGAGAGAGTAPVAATSGAGSSTVSTRASVLRDRRKATAVVGAIALLALGGALGATRSDEPAQTKAAAAESPSAAKAPSDAGTPSAAKPAAAAPGGPRTVKDVSPASLAPSSVAGYSALDPNVTNLLAADGTGADGSGAGAGSADGSGSGDSSGSDGALAFTGLDLLVLLAAGLGLLALGLGMRLAATRPVR